MRKVHFPIASLVLCLTVAMAPLSGAQFEEHDGIVSMEAENFTEKTGEGWHEESTHQNIDARSGTAMYSGIYGERGILRYSIKINQPGEYKLYVLGYAPHLASDNFLVFFDDEPKDYCENCCKYPYGSEKYEANGKRDFEFFLKDYIWSNSAKDKKGDCYCEPLECPAKFQIAKPGTYDLYLVKGAGEPHPGKPDEYLVDKIVLTLGEAPTGLGPPETLLGKLPATGLAPGNLEGTERAAVMPEPAYDAVGRDQDRKSRNHSLGTISPQGLVVLRP